MKKIKVSELQGAALDWAVAKCEGFSNWYWNVFDDCVLVNDDPFMPSTDWSQGGPIIDREGISLKKGHSGWWVAKILDVNDDEHFVTVAPTPLIAAMRCYVASKLGEEVEVPDELLGETA